MRQAKRKRLEEAGWKVGDAADFLDLSNEERAVLELKLALGREIKTRRLSRNWTQSQFAEHIRSSQSRVAKMESGDPSVSFDLLIRSLLAAGANRHDLARVMRRIG